MVSWKDGRRKLRLKHQRFMLTLDRQLEAVLTGASATATASASGEALTAQPEPFGRSATDGAGNRTSTAATQAGTEERGAAAEHATQGNADSDHKHRARTVSGCLEGTDAAQQDREQGRAGLPARPASAPSVLQRSSETEAMPDATGQTSAAGTAWLPAPSSRPGDTVTGRQADVGSAWAAGAASSASTTSNTPSVAHVISSFGGPAWGATEARLLEVVSARW